MDAVTLSSFTLKNIYTTFDWIRNKELQLLFTIRKEPTWETHWEHFNKVLFDPTQLVYAIYIGDRHIGNCGLKNIKERRAELWIYIGDKVNRAKGYGNNACIKLLAKAKEKGLFYLYLHVLTSNRPAIRMYINLGFQQIKIDPIDMSQWKRRSLEVQKMEKKI